MRSRLASQAEDHLSSRHGMGINPVHVGERTPAHMMIEVDQEAVLQFLQTRAVSAVELQNNRCLIVAGHAIRLHHLIGERQRAIDAWDAVVQHHVGLLPHGPQNLAARQRRSDGVAIGPRVRRQYKPVALFDLLKDLLQHRHAFYPVFGRAFILFFARASNSSTRAFSRSERSSRKYNSGARLSRRRSASSCLIYSLAAVKPSRLRSASRSSPSTSTRTCAERPSSATCTPVTPTTPMRRSASSPSTSVSISSRKASPNRPRWYFPARFSTFHLEVKRMRISEKRQQVLACKRYCLAQRSERGNERGNNA